ncbi:phosphatidate cytidylyltransferase [Bacteroidota bacterium]
MSNFSKRTLTGILIVAFIVSAILLSKVSFFLLFLLVVFLSTQEFYNLSTFEHVKPQRNYGSVVAIIIYIMFYNYAQHNVDEKIFLPIIPLTISFFLVELFRKEKHPFQNIAYTILGIIYTAIPFSLFHFFVFEGDAIINYNPYFLLSFFILIWVYDTGAYLVGMLLGSSPLFRRISPKKTWEGLIGGAIIAGLTAWLLSTIFEEYTFLDWQIISAIIVIMGTFGDLTESIFKRSIDVKESGHVLPGHGGMLDRFDGVLLAAPVVFMYLKMIS